MGKRSQRRKSGTDLLPALRDAVDSHKRTVLSIELPFFSFYFIDATVKSAFERGFEVIIPEGTNSTFDNNYMTGEIAFRYYNEDVWEELVDAVTREEAIDLLGE